MRRHSIPLRTLLACFAVSVTFGAVAHPEATLKSDVTSVRAGTAWPVRGENFQADQKVQLALQGALAEYKLREAQAANDGTFILSLDIPAEMRPGGYRLVALADDGDTVANLDVTVEPAATPVASAGHEVAAEGGVSHGGGSEARADELPIQRSRSGAEWGVIGLLIGLAGGFGLTLLRRPA
jgi:hypothetical protein